MAALPAGAGLKDPAAPCTASVATLPHIVGKAAKVALVPAHLWLLLLGPLLLLQPQSPETSPLLVIPVFQRCMPA